MALARCEVCGCPTGLKNTYEHPHTLRTPIKILCGAAMCTRYAVLWLTDDEQRRYMRGVRMFRLSNRAVEAEVK